MKAGIDSDLAIATAEKFLGFSVPNTGTRKVGALPVSGGGSGSEIGLLSVRDRAKLRGAKRSEYKKTHGSKTL